MNMNEFDTYITGKTKKPLVIILIADAKINNSLVYT